MKRQPVAVRPVALPRKPWLPLLLRAALGFGLAALGTGAVWWASVPTFEGKFAETRTTQVVNVGGTSQLQLTLRGDRTTLQVRPADVAGVQVEALHRKLNPLHVQRSRVGQVLLVSAGLFVDPTHSRGVLIGFEPGELKGLFAASDWPTQLQHELVARVGGPQLRLETQTQSGPQNIDLAGLDVVGAAATSESGDLALALPARASKSLSLTSKVGNITVTGGALQPLPKLAIDTYSGDIQADLSHAAVRRLSAATQLGDTALTFPLSTAYTRVSLSTRAGEQTVTIPAASRGHLHVSNRLGEVRLRLAAGTPYRLRLLGAEKAGTKALAQFAHLTQRAGVYYSGAALQRVGDKQRSASWLDITLHLGAGADLKLEEWSAAQPPLPTQGE